MADRPDTDTAAPQTVLIVDDSDQVRALLKRVLQDEGLLVRMASNGVEALAAISETPPDLALLDVMMPVMDGLSTLKQLRSQPGTAELPVIMVTALDTVDQVVRGLEMGANDYLTKPIQIEVLMARVRTQLKLKRLQDQRAQAIRDLREMDALKDKFLQIAAHDLRNPLANITLGLEWLGMLDVGPIGQQEKYTDVMAMMRMATGMMKSIVNDYLALQALRSGSVHLKLAPTNVNDVILETIGQYQAYIERKKTRIDLDLDPKLPMCQADSRHLVQIVSNLVSNAIKFSPEESAVHIRTRRCPNGVRVEVQDAGPGILEEEIPMLFKEFARLSNHPTAGEHSSGVGLAIVKNLVELHHGQVGVASQHGKGSVFWFELPVRSGKGTESAAPSGSPS
jgi:two-component system sensor histidine kinase/response regulator